MTTVTFGSLKVGEHFYYMTRHYEKISPTTDAIPCNALYKYRGPGSLTAKTYFPDDAPVEVQ